MRNILEPDGNDKVSVMPGSLWQGLIITTCMALINTLPGARYFARPPGDVQGSRASGPRKFYQVRNAQGTGENIGNLYKGRGSPGRLFMANGLHTPHRPGDRHQP